ncbi:hypothetical protein [Cupriavidus sp. UYPR2.512]|uniref:hypothetical protein n=1 Tax=Cupriavidus sp. UYPR2.512 TaxID=1080187 RepID=UPI00039ECB0B|nr:hypothetical protein [Cupriavidus sp. UYPR2.512]UIF87132.1 hypothetical protein KAF44_06035 [Cupriavidus necator]
MLRRTTRNGRALKIDRPARNFLPFCYAVQHKFGAHDDNRFKLTQANAFFRHVR